MRGLLDADGDGLFDGANPTDWSVSASTMFPGTCNETYTVTGDFIDEITFEGTFQASFSGWTCGDCSPQVWDVSATR
jgi:hypothetical protein